MIAKLFELIFGKKQGWKIFLLVLGLIFVIIGLISSYLWLAGLGTLMSAPKALEKFNGLKTRDQEQQQQEKTEKKIEKIKDIANEQAQKEEREIRQKEEKRKKEWASQLTAEEIEKKILDQLAENKEDKDDDNA